MTQKDGLTARAVCVNALAACLDDEQTLEQALERALAQQENAQEHRAFARNCTATCLRRLGQVDALIAQHMKRRPRGKAIRALYILRLAVTELVFLDHADHAVVHSAVELSKRHSASRALSGMVNGVLRNIMRERTTGDGEADAARTNTPDVLWALLSETYGVDAARAIALAHLDAPPVDLSLNTGVDAQTIAQDLGGVTLRGEAIRLTRAGAVPRLPGYENGDWWVQDYAARLPVALIDDLEGKRVLDLCAAPGGKTAQLAARGAHVTAVDNSEERAKRLSGNLARLKLNVDVIVADALTHSFEPASFDCVIVDAPCSASGTIRRHPELAQRIAKRGWVTSAHLLTLQSALLRRAASLVRVGGSLVYCTCSLDPAEGEQQIAAFLEASDYGFSVAQPIRSRSLLAPYLCSEHGWLRTTPALSPQTSDGSGPAGGGMDGFFAARLDRTPEVS